MRGRESTTHAVFLRYKWNRHRPPPCRWEMPRIPGVGHVICPADLRGYYKIITKFLQASEFFVTAAWLLSKFVTQFRVVKLGNKRHSVCAASCLTRVLIVDLWCAATLRFGGCSYRFPEARKSDTWGGG